VYPNSNPPRFNDRNDREDTGPVDLNAAAPENLSKNQ
jgi:hypothetical protein